jgi:hypothetical protein
MLLLVFIALFFCVTIAVLARRFVILQSEPLGLHLQLLT